VAPADASWIGTAVQLRSHDVAMPSACSPSSVAVATIGLIVTTIFG
jgi:hypothetical protein